MAAPAPENPHRCEPDGGRNFAPKPSSRTGGPGLSGERQFATTARVLPLPMLPTTPIPRLVVVIVTHNTRIQTLRLLDDLAADPDHGTWEVVVIDNASADGTLEAIAEAHPWARVQRNDPGRGFAGGVNQGVALTSAPVIVTPGPDTRVPPGSLGRLLEVLQTQPDTAAVGPLVRFPDGTIQPHGMFPPRPYTALIVLLGLSRYPLFRQEMDRYYGRHLPGAPSLVEQLTGACLMFRREAFTAVGPFDERFFVYCEDVDWCLRARQAGWRLLFVPEVVITHEKALTSRSNGAWTIRTYYRSLRAFYAKHHAPTAPLPLRWLMYAGSYLQEGRALLTDRFQHKGLEY
jgi:GT2 family glycosyltransferase